MKEVVYTPLPQANLKNKKIFFNLFIVFLSARYVILILST